MSSLSLQYSFDFDSYFFRFDLIFALYIMFKICHWLESGQSGLFIQLQIIVCVFFSRITGWFNVCLAVITYFHIIFMVVWKNAFELKEGNIYRCCWSCISTEYGDLQNKSLYSRRMWRNADKTNLECKHFSWSRHQNIATLVWYHCPL